MFHLLDSDQVIRLRALELAVTHAANTPSDDADVTGVDLVETAAILTDFIVAGKPKG